MTLGWDTLAEDVVRAVARTLSDGLPGMRVQCLEELSDGPQDTPLIQVHWFGDSWDPHSGDTDRTTFQGALKQMALDLQLWAFLRQRGLVGEDQAAVVEWGDRIRAVLLAQGTELFGTTGSPRVRTCGFRAETVSWTASGDRRYAGIRYHLSIRVY